MELESLLISGGVGYDADMPMLRRKHVAILSVGAAAALILAGCTRNTEGNPEWAPNQASKPIEADQVEEILLDNTEVVEIIGAQVEQGGRDYDIPEKPDGALKECQVMLAIGQRTDEYAGDGWSGFRARVSTDRQNDNITFFAQQTAIVYDNKDAAKATMAAVSREMKACDGKQTTNPEAGDWKYKVEESNDDTIMWTNEQTDAAQRYRCFGEGRIRDNVILRGYTCRSDKDGRPETDALLNRMSDNVWKLATPNGGG